MYKEYWRSFPIIIWFALLTVGFTHASRVKVVPDEMSKGDSKEEDKNCDPESERAVSVSVVVATRERFVVA